MTQAIDLEAKGLNYYYNGDIHALRDISLPIYDRHVTALIEPSGCGKTTLLRALVQQELVGARSRCLTSDRPNGASTRGGTGAGATRAGRAARSCRRGRAGRS